MKGFKKVGKFKVIKWEVSWLVYYLESTLFHPSPYFRTDSPNFFSASFSSHLFYSPVSSLVWPIFNPSCLIHTSTSSSSSASSSSSSSSLLLLPTRWGWANRLGIVPTRFPIWGAQSPKKTELSSIVAPPWPLQVGGVVCSRIQSYSDGHYMVCCYLFPTPCSLVRMLFLVSVIISTRLDYYESIPLVEQVVGCNEDRVPAPVEVHLDSFMSSLRKGGDLNRRPVLVSSLRQARHVQPIIEQRKIDSSTASKLGNGSENCFSMLCPDSP